MSEGGQRPLSVVRTDTDLFDAAAHRVTTTLLAMVGDELDGLEDVARALETIVTDVRLRLTDPDCPLLGPGTRADPLFAAFVEIVEMDILSGEPDPETAMSSLRVLRVLSELKGPGGPEDAQAAARMDDLRARLRAPDAFELLLEVAHDFRSPLTSILFLAETLRDGNSGDVTELQRSQLGLVYSAAFGLASVASDIMDLARREKDLIDDEPQPYALPEVFESVRRLVNPIVEEKGLELRLSVPERMTAYGHPHALSRVMLNLTTNALKFTDEGHVTIGVTPVAKSRLEFYVQDTGRGIPTDRRGELFRPFKRRLGENQEGHFFSGSGVGLSIARRLVKAMGSDLLLETSDANGTRFSFAVLNTPGRLD